MVLQYSIKDLERLSGIKAHTLRIWEKRYGILAPQRTESNIRCYSGDELRKLLNVALLNNHGYRISAIAKMPEEELHQKVLTLGDEEMSEDVQMDNLVIAMVEVDEFRFEESLNNCLARLGFEVTMREVVLPFFRKIGILWQAGAVNPAQEHFVTNLVRQKLIAEIDQLKLKDQTKKAQFLLFLPEGEQHELGLLFYCYLIRNAGHRVVYLGQSVPMDDVFCVDQQRPSHHVVTARMGDTSTDTINLLLGKLCELFPGKTLHLINWLPEPELLLKSEHVIINQGLDNFKNWLSTLD